jgi:hypothetical protein
VLTAAVLFVVLEFFAALAESLADAHHWAAAGLWGIFAFLLWIVGVFWLQGALVEAVSDLRDGAPSSRSRSSTHGLGRFCPR